MLTNLTYYTDDSAPSSLDIARAIIGAMKAEKINRMIPIETCYDSDKRLDDEIIS